MCTGNRGFLRVGSEWQPKNNQENETKVIFFHHGGTIVVTGEISMNHVYTILFNIIHWQKVKANSHNPLTTVRDRKNAHLYKLLPI